MANPEINSEDVTRPKTGPITNPYAISKTIEGILILFANIGSAKAPRLLEDTLEEY